MPKILMGGTLENVLIRGCISGIVNVFHENDFRGMPENE